MADIVDALHGLDPETLKLAEKRWASMDREELAAIQRLNALPAAQQRLVWAYCLGMRIRTHLEVTFHVPDAILTNAGCNLYNLHRDALLEHLREGNLPDDIYVLAVLSLPEEWLDVRTGVRVPDLSGVIALVDQLKQGCESQDLLEFVSTLGPIFRGVDRPLAVARATMRGEDNSPSLPMVAGSSSQRGEFAAEDVVTPGADGAVAAKRQRGGRRKLPLEYY